MAEIQAKDRLTLLKAYFRSNPYPVDADMVKDSIETATTYAKGATAYAGQMLTALNTDTNKYELYVLQPGDSGYTLEKPGVDASQLKQYVVVTDSLPGSNQVEGVLYINKTDSTGSIWTDGSWKQVFSDVSEDVADFESRIGELETNIALKAPINNPVFTGTVTLAADPNQNLEAVTKQYVDRLIAGIKENSTPGIVDGTDHPIPTTDYKAGQMWRVSVAGTYVGQKCEPGDLIICLKDYAAEGASNDDFLVVQANIDGAVTSSTNASTDGNIVVFDGITGKIIKDSTVAVASLNDAISKAHEHANKSILDTYDKNQTDLLAAAQSTAQGLVDTLAEEVDKKANKGTTLAEYGITDAYTKTDVDGIKSTLEGAINGKVDAATVDGKISAAIGDLSGDTVKDYVDAAVASGGSGNLEQIKEYVNGKIGNIGEDPDVATYVTNKINLAMNVIEF